MPTSAGLHPAGALLDVSARVDAAAVTVSGASVNVQHAGQLSSTEGLTTRAEIFHNSTIATGSPGGWAPAP